MRAVHRSSAALLIALAAAGPAIAKKPARARNAGARASAPAPAPAAPGVGGPVLAEPAEETKASASTASSMAAEGTPPGGGAITGIDPTPKSCSWKRSHWVRAQIDALLGPVPPGGARVIAIERPAVMGGRGLLPVIAVEGAKQSWLVPFDPELRGKVFHTPLLVPDAISSLTWIHPELAMVASGLSRIDLVEAKGDGALRVSATLPAIPTDWVSEIAHDPANRAHFLSVGEKDDAGLACLVDLERAGSLQAFPLPGKGTSARWPKHHQWMCPSVTTEEGEFMIYDLRTPPGHPAFKATAANKHLYAHERCTDHHVLLGFGDGDILHLDVRVTDRSLNVVKDPYVEHIGDMQYDQGLLVVSGVPDFTLWWVRPTDGVLEVVGHAKPDTTRCADPATHDAILLDARTVLDVQSDPGIVRRVGI